MYLLPLQAVRTVLGSGSVNPILSRHATLRHLRPVLILIAAEDVSVLRGQMGCNPVRRAMLNISGLPGKTIAAMTQDIQSSARAPAKARNGFYRALIAT